MMGILTVLWEKWREFRRDFLKITVSAALSPVMYLIVFGLGIRSDVDGKPYLYFLIPGLVAMASMTGSFSAVMQNMSVQRLYEKALEQVLISPTPLWQFLAGQIIGGSLRGLYASLVIFLIVQPLSIPLVFNGLSFLILLLNGTVFSTLALALSFLAKSYADAPRFTSYIIMPMSFLCNTFFSAERLPDGIRQFISVLPLSLTCDMVRDISAGAAADRRGLVILLLYTAFFMSLSFWFIYRKENMD